LRSENQERRRISGFSSWFASRILYPAAAGLAVFFAYPTITGYQDIASLASAPIEQRWLAHLPEAPGGTVLAAAMSVNAETAEIDPVITGATRADRRAEQIVVGVKQGREPQRINRTGMGGRVVQATAVAPPAAFNAGAVAERHSFLAPIDDGKVDLAFASPLALDKAQQVAMVFHKPEEPGPKIDPDLPVMVAKLVVESAPHVLAYNPEPAVLRSPFAAVLEDDEPVSLIPKLDKNDHAWAAQPLPLSSFSDREQHCLTAGIYFEARGEPVRGQAAVAQVIRNRVKNPAYPDTICGVVYQNKEWRNRCQFSFACDKIKDKVNDPKRWAMASYVAKETTEGRIWLTEVGSSTHYHATYVKPNWASTMRKVGKIGLHIFYRTIGGGWS